MLVMARTARENVIRECWLFVGDTAIIIKYTDVIQKLIFDRCYSFYNKPAIGLVVQDEIQQFYN